MGRLDIGAMVADGANKFLQGYMQGKQLELQEKVHKNQGILKALEYILNDDNAPMQKRVEALDAYQRVFDPNAKISLSQQLGLWDLINSPVITEEGATGIPGRAGIPSVESDTGATSANDVLQTTIQTKEIKPLPEVPEVPATTKRYGDMTPNQFKSLNIRREREAGEEAEFNRQKRLAELDREMRIRLLQEQGFTKELEPVTDAEGNYAQPMFNPTTGEVRLVKIPQGYKPLKQSLAETRAKNASGGLPAAVKAYTAYFATQINPDTNEPYTPEEASAKALEYYKQNGDIMFRGKQLGVVKGEQETEGRKPVQPAERERLDNDKLNRITSMESDLVTIESDLNAATLDAETLHQEVNIANARLSQAEVNFQQYKNDDPSDEDYKASKSELDKARADADDKTEKYRKARARLKGLQTKSNDKKKQIDALTNKPSASSSRNNGTSTTKVLTLDSLNPTQRNYVTKYFGGDLQKAIDYNKNVLGKKFP